MSALLACLRVKGKQNQLLCSLNLYWIPSTLVMDFAPQHSEDILVLNEGNLLA